MVNRIEWTDRFGAHIVRDDSPEARKERALDTLVSHDWARRLSQP